MVAYFVVLHGVIIVFVGKQPVFEESSCEEILRNQRIIIQQNKELSAKLDTVIAFQKATEAVDEFQSCETESCLKTLEEKLTTDVAYRRALVKPYDKLSILC